MESTVTSISLPSKPDYGLDAPAVVRNLLLAGTAGLLIGYFLQPRVSWLGNTLGFAGVILLLEGIYCYWSSRVGKKIQRDKLISQLNLQGHEQILDVGCGRGLLLIGAAKKLTSGKATGIDLWQNEDLSSNSPEALSRNAKLEDVLPKIEIVSGDARQMPFADNTFDCIISSMALHNIYDPTQRAQALKEVFRVLKPGGKFFIQDFRHTKEYASYWTELGAKEVAVSGPILSLYGARLVSGKK